MREWTPTSNETTGGRIQVRSVSIPAGVRVVASMDLDVIASGEIIVKGVIAAQTRGGASRTRGISIRLSSSRRIEVSGNILAGDGKAGLDSGLADDREIAVAGNGASGGNIILSARAIVLRKSSTLSSGDGGAGGQARGMGRPATYVSGYGGNAVAVGGNGGDGGSISFLAKSVRVEHRKGMIKLGNGGDGGGVSATGGRGGNSDGQHSPGIGGGVYSRGGDGGDSGSLGLENMKILRGRKLASPNPKILKALVTGGKGGEAGLTEGEKGESGMP